MIRVGGHGFVELRPVHGLNRRNDLGAIKSKRGGGPHGGGRHPQPFDAARGSLEGFEVVSWLPLFRHAEIYTIVV
jgi:hypothetical protein